MIYGGFDPVVQEGASTPDPYVQGFIRPVSEGNKEAYREAAMGMWEIMKDHGATRIIEAWQDDVPKGQQTDFFRATKAESGEAVVFSFVDWSSHEPCDGPLEKSMPAGRRTKAMERNPARKTPFDACETPPPESHNPQP